MTPTSEELQRLLERVEGASGPDRELSEAIARDLAGWTFEKRGNERKAWWRAPGQDFAITYRNAPPHFTASMDAAVALVEKMLPGWSWQIRVSVSSDGEVRYSNAQIWQPSDPRDDESPHYFANSSDKTPALAICAALLRALIQKENGG